jgi:hypothetical protein
MIILRLRGGLGNQLFQYASARALAEHHGTQLKLDLYYYKKHPYRKFELDRFAVPIDIASREEVHRFTGSNPIQRYLNKRENYYSCPKVFAQPHYHYYPDWLNLPDDLYLSGYFQSEKYFSTIQDKIRQWYVPSKQLDDRNTTLLNEMKTKESVSLHVRRGDYTAASFNSFFGTLPDDYYRRAVAHINQQIKAPAFYIFSDDIAWCKTNLKVGDSPVFVEHNRGDDSFKDVLLMSGCKHNVIANSSFSWWGAWLNDNPSKTVVAPAKWFNQSYYTGKGNVYPTRYYNTSDLIPSNWLRL